MEVLFLLLMPILQLGESGYVAVATLSALIVVVRFRRQVMAGAARAPWVAFLPLFMLASLASSSGTDLVQSVLRTGREALVLLLLIWTVHGAGLAPAVSSSPKALVRTAAVLMVGIFAITAVQFVMFRQGIYFGIPLEYYNNQTALVPTEEALRFQVPRPMATFSEPSYLGIVAISLMVVASKLERHLIARTVIFVSGILSGILCQAASFILFAAMLFLVGLAEGGRARAKLAAMLILPYVLLAIVLFAQDFAPIQRILSGNATDDFSFFVRVFGPFEALAGYITHYPFGLPANEVPAALEPFIAATDIPPESFLSNSITNMLFQYGIGGAVLIAVLLWAPRTYLLRAYMLAAMLQSGGILGLDKLALVGFTICMAHAFQPLSRRRGAVARTNVQVRGTITPRTEADGVL